MRLARSESSRPGGGSLAPRLAMVLAGGLCVLAGLAIWFLVTGHFDATGVRILGSTMVVSLCAVAGLVGATVLDRRDFRRALGTVTVLLAAIEVALALLAIWSVLLGDTTLRALGAFGALLLACAHACLMLGRLRARDGGTVRGLTAASVAFAMLGALLVAGGFAFATGPGGSGFWRLLGVLAVLATLTTLVAPIVRRLDRGRAGGQAPADAERSAPPPARKPTGPSLMLGLDRAG